MIRNLKNKVQRDIMERKLLNKYHYNFSVNIRIWLIYFIMYIFITLYFKYIYIFMNKLIMSSDWGVNTPPKNPLALTLSQKNKLLATIKINPDQVAELVLRDNGTTPDNLKLLELMEIVGIKATAQVLVPIVTKNHDTLQEIFENASEMDGSALSIIVLEFTQQNSSVALWKWFFAKKWKSINTYSELWDDVKTLEDIGEITDPVRKWWKVIYTSEMEELMNHISEIAPELARKIRASMKLQNSQSIPTWAKLHTKKDASQSIKITSDDTSKKVDTLLPKASDYV